MSTEESPAAVSVSASTAGAAPVPVEAGELHLNYIASSIKRRQCILFLGSAIHVASPTGAYGYTADKALPTESALAKHLAARGEFPSEDTWNLQRVAQHYEYRAKSRFLLVSEIQAVLNVGREPSPLLSALGALDFPIVITTNYDRLYERVLTDRGIPHDVAIYDPEKREPTKDCAREPKPQRPFLLKLHGDIERPESLVITDEDYIHFMLRMTDKHPYHPVGKNVLTYLAAWPTLFVGYSLIDYNFRVIFKTLRWKLDAAHIPPNYSVDRKPDELIRDIYENQHRYITFIVEDVWNFVPRLFRAVTGKDIDAVPGAST